MGQLETRSDLAFRRDCRAGRGLVHGTVLRALLPANSAESERAVGAIHHCDCAAIGDAALCSHGSAFGSYRAQVDHDGGVFARGGVLHADLRCDAACGRIECGHGTSQPHPVTGGMSLIPQTEVNGVLQPAQEVLPYTDFASLISSPVALKLILLVFIQVFFVTMVYGPIAAYLVEAFPAKIRYTSLSLPYHIGNGIFGGLLPVIGLSVVANTGNIYAGLYYPIIVAEHNVHRGIITAERDEAYAHLG